MGNLFYRSHFICSITLSIGIYLWNLLTSPLHMKKSLCHPDRVWLLCHLKHCICPYQILALLHLKGPTPRSKLISSWTPGISNVNHCSSAAPILQGLTACYCLSKLILTLLSSPPVLQWTFPEHPDQGRSLWCQGTRPLQRKSRNGCGVMAGGAVIYYIITTYKPLR